MRKQIEKYGNYTIFIDTEDNTFFAEKEDDIFATSGTYDGLISNIDKREERMEKTKAKPPISAWYYDCGEWEKCKVTSIDRLYRYGKYNFAARITIDNAKRGDIKRRTIYWSDMYRSKKLIFDNKENVEIKEKMESNKNIIAGIEDENDKLEKSMKKITQAELEKHFGGLN